MVKDYYNQNGSTQIPSTMVVKGVWLRKWLTEQVARLNERPTGRNKTVKKLTKEQIKCLRSVEIKEDKSGKPNYARNTHRIESSRNAV